MQVFLLVYALIAIQLLKWGLGAIAIIVGLMILVWIVEGIVFGRRIK